MLNDQVSRIINSKVCDSIASTVSKNHQELQELEGALAERSQQILMLHEHIASEIQYFEKVCKKNHAFRDQGKKLSQAAADLRTMVATLKDCFTIEFEKVTKEIHSLMVMSVQEMLSRLEEQKQAEFERIITEERQKASEEIKRLTNLLLQKDSQFRNQQIRIEQIQKINTELKKEELSKIFSKKQSNISLTIPENYRQNTAQSDIFRALDRHDNTQNTFTQPNLEQTALLGDFSRKRSLIISPSSTTISIFHVFDFEKLIEIGYEGKKLAGKKTANGIATYEGRYSYDGEFVRDIREGYGVLKQGKEIVYIGGWKNGLFNGKGTINVFPSIMKYKNWRSYTGHFYQGNIEGIGTVIFVNGETLLCNFKSGTPISKGILFEFQDANISYGQYKNQTFTNTL